MPAFRFAQECDSPAELPAGGYQREPDTWEPALPRPLHCRAPRDYRGIFDGATCAQLADAADQGAALEEISRVAPEPARTPGRSVAPLFFFAALAYALTR